MGGTDLWGAGGGGGVGWSAGAQAAGRPGIGRTKSPASANPYGYLGLLCISFA